MQLALSGEPLDATVIYYGNLVTDEKTLAALRWPVLGIFGDQDQSIPVAKVNEFDAALLSLSGATTVTVAHLDKAVANTFSPGANTPSSLLIKIFIIFYALQIILLLL